MLGNTPQRRLSLFHLVGTHVIKSTPEAQKDGETNKALPIKYDTVIKVYMQQNPPGVSASLSQTPSQARKAGSTS